MDGRAAGLRQAGLGKLSENGSTNHTTLDCGDRIVRGVCHPTRGPTCGVVSRRVASAGRRVQPPDRVDGHQCGGGGRRAGTRRPRPLLVTRRWVGAQDGLARGDPAHRGAERRVPVGDPCVVPHRSRHGGGAEFVDRTLFRSRGRTAADSNAGHTGLARSACVVGCHPWPRIGRPYSNEPP